jgi:hypothetical protein
MRRSAGIVTGIAVWALAAAAAWPAPQPPAPREAQRSYDDLRRDVDLLQKQVALASGENFYLVLDPDRSRITLMLRGAVLQEYRIVAMEMGTPRVAFLSADPPDGWRGRIWSKGTLDPQRERERLVMEAPPPSDNPDEEPAPPKIPPTPEEAYPVPHRYHVRFEGGISLEIRRQGDEIVAGSWWQRVKIRFGIWWDDLMAAMNGSRPDSDYVRLRVTLTPNDADSLYRALPPDVGLLVLPSA